MIGDEPVGGRPLHAFFEYHIEQGPILEAEGIDIGVVTHGQGLWWLEVTLTGKESACRLDADAACASMPASARRASSSWCNEIALAHAPHAVGAVGALEALSRTRATSSRARWSSPSTSAHPIRHDARSR